MGKLIGLALCAVLASSVAACGGGNRRAQLSGEEVRAAATVQEFIAHLAHGESEAACALLTDGAKRQLARSLDLPDMIGDPEGGCLLAAAMVTESWSAAERSAIPQVRIRRVELHGDRASVPMSAVEFPKSIEHLRADDVHQNVLLRVHGVWLIDNLA